MTTPFNKPNWRRANFAFIQQNAPLDRGGMLRFPYIELLGNTPTESSETTKRSVPEMFQLMERMIPEPQFFIGVDRDPVVVLRHMLNTHPFRIVYGDFFDIVLRELPRSTEMGAAIPPNVPRLLSPAIFNYDGQNWVGSPKWWETEGKRMRETVQRSVGANGIALFILNHVLSVRGEARTRRPARLRQHTEALLRLFHDWNPPPLQAIFDDKLPPDDGLHDRMVGAYHLYRSEGRPTEMATLRMVFDRKGLHIHTQRRF
jgi:hypothetical protein